jgi:hypothetical protein
MKWKFYLKGVKNMPTDYKLTWGISEEERNNILNQLYDDYSFYKRLLEVIHSKPQLKYEVVKILYNIESEYYMYSSI